MTRRAAWTLAAAAAASALLGGLAAPAYADPLSPFGKPAGGGSLSPVRWDGGGDAGHGNNSNNINNNSDNDDKAKSRKVNLGMRVAQAGTASEPAQPATAAAAPTGAGGTVPAGGACKSDDACALGTYCDAGKCREVQQPINILWLYYRSPDRRFTEVMGIYWHQRGETGYKVVLPLYWHFWNPERRTRVVFPFYYEVDDHKTRVSHVVVPPFQYRETPTEKNYRFWPVFFYTDYGDRGSGVTVLPLFHREREGTRTSTIIPILLSGYAQDPQRNYSRGLIGGVYYWHREGEHYNARAVFPLFYHATGLRRSFTWVFPVAFHWRRGEDRTVVVPPLFMYRRKGEHTRIANLVPPAFYHHDRSAGTAYGTVFPLFYYGRDDRADRSTVLSPVFLYERDGKAKLKHWGLVVPPYYSRRDQDLEVDTLLPIFLRWRNKVERTTTIVAGPVVYHDDEVGGTQAVLPLFWRFTDARTGAATSILFPLAYRHKRPDGSQLNVLFPLFYRSDHTAWGAGLVPLVWLGAGSGYRHAVVFPVFWHFKSPERSTTVAGPVYYRAEKDRWHAGLAPVLHLAGGARGSYQVFFPVFWHFREHDKDKGTDSDTWIAGPAFYHRNKARRVFGAVPLFGAGTLADGTSFQTVLPPLFYRSRHEATGKGKLLVGPYFGWEEPGVRGHAVLPVFYYRKDTRPGHRRTTVAAFPLAYYRQSADEQLLVTPLGGFQKDYKNGVLRALAGPVGWYASQKVRGMGIFPFFFHWERPAQKSTTTVLAPFFVRHVSPRLRAHVVFPLVWRFVEPKETSLVVFPIYWRLRQKEGIRADVVFPLYWDVRDKEGHFRVYGPVFSRKTPETYQAGVFPVAYYHRNKEGSTLAALPLVAYRNHFKEKQRTWLVGPFYMRKRGKGHDQGEGTVAGVLPLVYYQRAKDTDYTFVPPLFWQYKNHELDSSTTVVGPVFYRRVKQAKSVGVVPLFYTAWDDKGGRSLAVMPLFYRRSEPARSALYTPLFGFDSSPDLNQWYAGPFFRRTSPKHDLHVLFPLGVHYRNHQRGETTVGVLPVYFGRWSAEKSLHLVFPLLWRSAGVDRATTIVFPLFWDFNNRHVSRTTVVAPVFLRHRDNIEDETNWVVPPVWVRTRKKGTDVVAFPVVWHFGGDEESTTVGFPLYWDFKRPGKRTTVVFPLYWRFDRAAARTYVVGNVYYRRSKLNDTYNLFVVPFVQVAEKRPGDFLVEVLGGLAGYERVGRNRFVKVLFYPIKLEPTSSSTLSGMGGARNVSWVR